MFRVLLLFIQLLVLRKVMLWNENTENMSASQAVVAQHQHFYTAAPSNIFFSQVQQHKNSSGDSFMVPKGW